jgi:hypothetical protein
MEQEDIELLLKEFSGRLHYGLIVSPVDCGKARLIGCLLDSVLLQDIRTGKYYDKPWDIEYVKPYLRPMSSMTADEVHEYISLKESIVACDDITYAFETYKSIDWLNAHHFDYRGLIPKGLAIGVTPDNNPYES